MAERWTLGQALTLGSLYHWSLISVTLSSSKTYDIGKSEFVSQKREDGKKERISSW